MDQRITKSITQWVLSFLLLDVLLGAYILLSCLADPDLCGVGGTFAIGFFYGPFGVLLPSMGAWRGLDARIIAAPVLAVLIHIGLGVAVGYSMPSKVMRWGRTISIATSTSLAIAFIPTLLISVVGMFMFAYGGR